MFSITEIIGLVGLFIGFGICTLPFIVMLLPYNWTNWFINHRS